MIAAPKKLLRVIRKYPRATAIGAAAIAAVILVGWTAEVPSLRRLIPLGPPMAASTTVMTLLTCLALWSSSASPAWRPRWIVDGCAVAVCAIAGTALAFNAHIIDVSLDQVLPHIAHPSHASSQTAVSFVLLASAAVLGERRVGGVRLSDLFALAAGAIAMIALLGYVFDVPGLYGMLTKRPHVGMSVETGFVVLALCLGFLFTNVEHSVIAIVVAPDAGGVVARRLFAGAIAFPPCAALLLLGAGFGWYSFSFGEATVLMLAIAEGSFLIVSTATQLGRADRALRAAEAHVRLLVDQASDPIFTANLDDRLTAANDAACAILGYERDELLGRSLTEILAPEDVPRLAQSKQLVLTGATVVVERTLRRRDGTFVPVELSTKILPDGRWQGIARDITERKRHEAALAHAAEIEYSLRAELEALMAAVSYTIEELPYSDVDTVLRTIAEQARRLTGAEYAVAVLGTDPSKHPAESVRLINNVIEHPAYRGLPDGHPPIKSLLAVPIKHRDRVLGTLFLANKHNTAEFSEYDSRISGRLADRVAAALETATLYESEGRLRSWLRAIIDQLPDGVIIVDEHGQVKAINRALRDMALPRAKRVDPLGDPTVFDIRDSKRRPLVADELPIIRAFQTGETVRRDDLLFPQANGTMLQVEAAAGPVLDERGVISGAVMVVTDITDRKEAERLREEWIAIIAHDLRQPLNTILLSTDVLASLVQEEKPHALIERVRGGASRLNRMITDLLDAAQLEANQLAIDRRTVDAVELARVTIENAQLSNPDARLHLVSREHELVWADGDRIQQVLTNLVSNAIKYGASGTPVRIEIKSRDPWVEISVINQGPDISPTDRDHLFARFFRSPQTRSAKIPGIGLGLYICKGIVETHGGTIRVESDNGTIAFRFTLPRPPEN